MSSKSEETISERFVEALRNLGDIERWERFDLAYIDVFRRAEYTDIEGDMALQELRLGHPEAGSGDLALHACVHSPLPIELRREAIRLALNRNFQNIGYVMAQIYSLHRELLDEETSRSLVSWIRRHRRWWWYVTELGILLKALRQR